jgi:hypothetical protein
MEFAATFSSRIYNATKWLVEINVHADKEFIGRFASFCEQEGIATRVDENFVLTTETLDQEQARRATHWLLENGALYDAGE